MYRTPTWRTAATNTVLRFKEGLLIWNVFVTWRRWWSLPRASLTSFGLSQRTTSCQRPAATGEVGHVKYKSNNPTKLKLVRIKQTDKKKLNVFWTLFFLSHVLSVSVNRLYFKSQGKCTLSSANSDLTRRRILWKVIYKIRMAVFCFSRSTESFHWLVSIWNPLTEAVWLLLLLPSNKKLDSLLHDLDDVLVLHDVGQAHPLRTVLGTGSLKDRTTTRLNASKWITGHII